ncbi:hypothetical protein BLNAU_4103 [Blattamonas nauphoetae]|uniref:Uncharacterized protein n=1 Tax=Blattamonas nauphoetae TaxID=2049346 RepID=A0ABQ9YB66_9EUKA|nr:hypothetical protein BLNAU_4103 [Blattamonas nauphoetae]
MEIPPRVDEERSVAMSQSSQFSTMQALSVARFKPMEQMLFFYAYPLSRVSSATASNSRICVLSVYAYAMDRPHLKIPQLARIWKIWRTFLRRFPLS